MKIAKQQVTLIDHMGTDLSIVNAARVSFDKESEWEVISPASYDEFESLLEMGWEDFTDYDRDGGYFLSSLSDKDKKLIKYLSDHNHWSPFSHASVSFRIKAPIFVARQLVKHQVGLSWNEVSRRYVDSEPEFFIPEGLRKKAENVKQGSTDEYLPEEIFGVDEHGDYSWEPLTLVQYVSEHALQAYKDLLAEGCCAEQARMVLPQNTMTEWIWSGTLYAFARVVNLRRESHSQRETQEVARMISDEMKKLFPVSWSVLVKEA